MPITDKHENTSYCPSGGGPGPGEVKREAAQEKTEQSDPVTLMPPAEVHSVRRAEAWKRAPED